jgi:hypothetical protein
MTRDKWTDASIPDAQNLEPLRYGVMAYDAQKNGEAVGAGRGGNQHATQSSPWNFIFPLRDDPVKAFSKINFMCLFSKDLYE